jgi:hypothetical protein
LEKRAENWIKKLSASSVDTIPADELYAGDQWQISKSLPAVGAARGLRVQLWICSAGYGLVRSRSSLRPYSATFSASHPDSVRAGKMRLDRDVLAEWWEFLKRWEGPDAGELRSIASIAKTQPQNPLLIVASPVYLCAIRNDLEAALEKLRDPTLLTIISGGVERFGEMSSHVLPCDGRLQQALGGALMSLNVRVARRILENAETTPLNCRDLAKAYRRLLNKQPEMVAYDRQPMTDRDVLRYVTMRLEETPGMRISPMLRLLRDSGFACEQKRFGRLYRQIQERQNGR